MSARTMIRGCRRLTTVLSKHSSPLTKLHRRQPPQSPPQPSTTHPFIQLFNQPQIPFLPPQPHPQNSRIATLIRHFSSSTSASSSAASGNATPPSESESTTGAGGDTMKHQEIEGPTVERDLSPLANETRQVTNTLLKTMYNVSTFFALLGLAQLALGAYSYTTASAPAPYLSLTASVLAFGFPFSMAFMLRQSLKSMHFFEKMESIGRLQILTSTMQIFKQLRIFFVRVRALSILCLAGLSISFLHSLSSSL